MWNEVYVESAISSDPRVLSILQKLNRVPLIVERYDEIWGKSKKPYLQKRDTLNLFLAQKKGQLLKSTPDAYGTKGDAHFYFIHAFNCIYECQYCYLQGYFNTPDIVLFINHEEIIKQMQEELDKHAGKKVWFHAGEFSDSLALSHLTGELNLYHEFCKKNPLAIIELRTKSVNIRELEKLSPLENFITSFSLSPETMARKVDLKTPGTSSRLKAMSSLHKIGHPIAAHFDPIIYEDEFKKTYTSLLGEMKELGLTPLLAYLSVGVVRFTKDVYREVERNYEHSIIHTAPMVTSFDQKVRYNKPLRMWMMNSVKELAIMYGVNEQRIYLCMEDHA